MAGLSQLNYLCRYIRIPRYCILIRPIEDLTYTDTGIQGKIRSVEIVKKRSLTYEETLCSYCQVLFKFNGIVPSGGIFDKEFSLGVSCQ